MVECEGNRKGRVTVKLVFCVLAAVYLSLVFTALFKVSVIHNVQSVQCLNAGMPTNGLFVLFSLN